jgi:hypothetical protein
MSWSLEFGAKTNESLLCCHAELEEPAPYLIRGPPNVVPAKVGNPLKNWIPAFAGMTTCGENVSL